MSKLGPIVILVVLVVIACLCLVAFSTGGPGGSGVKVLKLSHITSNTSHWHRGGERFAELVGQRMQGRCRIELYPGAQLANGNQRTELQSVQMGSIEMSFESPIILALYLKEKRFDAFSMPWLFPDLRTARRACTGELGRIACQWLEKSNLVGIGIGVNGFRQLTNSKQVVRAPEDLKGIKFRVAGTDLFLNTFDLLGANAMKMNFGEVFTSLQEGVIDGQENPLAIIYTSKLYEVQKYLTLWNYAFDPIILCVNADVWNSIPTDDQAILRECAREAMEYQWDYSEKLERDILGDLEAKGMVVTRLSSEELATFRKLVEPIYKELEQSLGVETTAKWRAVVEEIAAAGPAKTTEGAGEGTGVETPGGGGSVTTPR